jgi:hypothetical protein
MVTDWITTSVLGGHRTRSAPPPSRHDLEPLHHLAEEGVLRRQADAGAAADDEELAAVRVGPGVRHRDRPDLVAAGSRELVGEGVPGAAGAGPLRVPALAHEALDDAVEDDAVVVVVPGEGDEVVDRLRRGTASRAMTMVPSEVTISAV